MMPVFGAFFSNKNTFEKTWSPGVVFVISAGEMKERENKNAVARPLEEDACVFQRVGLVPERSAGLGVLR